MKTIIAGLAHPPGNEKLFFGRARGSAPTAGGGFTVKLITETGNRKLCYSSLSTAAACSLTSRKREVKDKVRSLPFKP